jgi:DNA-binding NarL/FixJ family response regulator
MRLVDDESKPGGEGMSIKVAIVGGHPVLREGLTQILPKLRGIQICGEAGSVQELSQLVAAACPDVVIVGLDLADDAMFDAIRAITQGGTARCVAIASTNSRVQLERALAAGVTGYVLTSDSAEELANAVTRVHAGRTHVSTPVSGHLVDVIHAGHRSNAQPVFDLTRREHQVLEGIVSGFSCRELASDLGISTRTVERHRASVMAKLNVHKTAKLVRFAVREGLVQA